MQQHQQLTRDQAVDLLAYYGHSRPVSLLAWALTYRALDGHPFTLDKYPSSVALYKDEAPFIVVEKPNQVGISEWLINTALHALDMGAGYFGIEHLKKSLNVGYIFPTWIALRDFSKDRVRRIALETGYLSALLAPVRKAGSLRRESDLGLYFIRASALYLRGAHRPDEQLASFPVDILLVDEYDLITLRAIALAEKRLRASPLRLKRYISKPTLPNMGVDKLYQESDQHQWEIRCPTCGDWQPPDFWDNVFLVDRGKKLPYAEWSKRDRNDLLQSCFEFACRRCQTPLHHISPGRWQPQNQGAPIRGYRIPGLVSPYVPLIEIVKGSLAEEPDILLEWYRADLGLPKAPEGGQLKWDDLQACQSADCHLQQRAHRCTMGVDIGVNLHVRVSSYQKGTWQTVWIGEVDEFEQLDELMTRYEVRAAVIDALPETRSSRNFCLRWPGRAWMAYYSDTQKEVYVWKDPPEGERHREAGKVLITRTEAMDRVAANHREGKDVLPLEAHAVPGFFRHLCAPVRVMTTRTKTDGTHYSVAVYLESGPDHYYHASVYELAARERLKPALLNLTAGITTEQSAFEV